jgi:hypothetical protein
VHGGWAVAWIEEPDPDVVDGGVDGYVEGCGPRLVLAPSFGSCGFTRRVSGALTGCASWMVRCRHNPQSNQPTKKQTQGRSTSALQAVGSVHMETVVPYLTIVVGWDGGGFKSTAHA